MSSYNREYYIKKMFKNKMKLYRIIILFFLVNLNYASNNTQKKIQESLIFAKDGSTVLLPKGIIEINRTLWGDNLNNVNILYKYWYKAFY